MTNTICLDEKYSTTRLLCKIVNDECLMLNGDEDNSKFKIQNSTLQKGGLRTKGYFKKSYSHCEQSETIHPVIANEMKQSTKPLISIITVVYSGEKYLEETIQSVINQTYDNVEYIIIDGGSTDGTLDIIKKYEDTIDYWVSEREQVGDAVFFMDLKDPNSLVQSLLTIKKNKKIVNDKIAQGKEILENWNDRDFYIKLIEIFNEYKYIKECWSHKC